MTRLITMHPKTGAAHIVWGHALGAVQRQDANFSRHVLLEELFRMRIPCESRWFLIPERARFLLSNLVESGGKFGAEAQEGTEATACVEIEQFDAGECLQRGWASLNAYVTYTDLAITPCLCMCVHTRMCVRECVRASVYICIYACIRFVCMQE